MSSPVEHIIFALKNREEPKDRDLQALSRQPQEFEKSLRHYFRQLLAEDLQAIRFIMYRLNVDEDRYRQAMFSPSLDSIASALSTLCLEALARLAKKREED